MVSSCATHKPKALKAAQIGMDKSDVLEALGNPTRKTRQHGLDRWTYESNPGEAISEVTYIFFDGGKVTYVGPAPEPQPLGDTKEMKKKEGQFQTVGE